MTVKSVKFNAALEELDQILEKIDGGKIDLDDLPKEIVRANALIELCRDKIRKAEIEVKKVLPKSA